MTAQETIDLDELNSRAWMAARIKKSEDWISHNLAKVPYIKIGRDVWFTERLAREYLEAQTVKPTVGRTARSVNSARRAR